MLFFLWSLNNSQNTVYPKLTRVTRFDVKHIQQKEGTVLLLADILCACYGWEAVPAVREPPPAAPAPARVDVSYVNNPSLADVTFRWFYRFVQISFPFTFFFLIKFNYLAIINFLLYYVSLNGLICIWSKYQRVFTLFIYNCIWYGKCASINIIGIIIISIIM